MAIMAVKGLMKSNFTSLNWLYIPVLTVKDFKFVGY